MAEYVNPEMDKESFNCPICGAYAKQIWSYAIGLDKIAFDIKAEKRQNGAIEEFVFSRCTYCKKNSIWNLEKKSLIYPKSNYRNFDLTYIPKDLAEDYEEACLVLSDSPKASAALSRRCLQGILREQGYSKKSLAQEIQLAITSMALPSYISDFLDAVRNIGNFAAHPMKDTNSGEVVPVEPGEAEWNLDVIESLFDFYYIQAAKTKAKQDALNEKIKSTKK